MVHNGDHHKSLACCLSRWRHTRPRGDVCIDDDPCGVPPHDDDDDREDDDKDDDATGDDHARGRE